ncbi:MAG: DUF3291 domain-containing protein [Pseudomonadota bacterium]
MPVVSITRLHLRSFFYLFPFALRAAASSKQAMRSAGCRGLVSRKTRGLAFWTLTLWDDEKSLKAFLMASPHREAMPKLAGWCDEACVTHWTQDEASMPDWASATQRLRDNGRLVRVAHPSEAHRNGTIEVS